MKYMLLLGREEPQDAASATERTLICGQIGPWYARLLTSAGRLDVKGLDEANVIVKALPSPVTKIEESRS